MQYLCQERSWLLALALPVALSFAAHAQQDLLQIVAPANNSVVRHGQTITISVTAATGVQNIGVIGQSPLAQAIPTSRNQFALSLSPNVPPGVYELTAIGTSAGKVIQSKPVSIHVEPSSHAGGLDVSPAVLNLETVGDQFPLRVMGTFPDGSKDGKEIDLTHSAQTTYRSNDPNVATVNASGMVTAVGPGETTILVRAGVTGAYTYDACMVHVPKQRPTGASPIITSVSPTSAVPSVTQVTVVGSGFGTQQGDGYLQLGTQNATIINWTDTKIVATAAPRAGSAVACVTRDNGLYSNRIPFNIAIPVIQAMYGPKPVPEGIQVTIVGSGFGASQGNGFVAIGETKAKIVSWTDTHILVSLPAGIHGRMLVHQKGTNSRPITLYPQR